MTNLRYCNNCHAVWPQGHKLLCPEVWSSKIDGKRVTFDTYSFYVDLKKLAIDRNLTMSRVSEQTSISSSTLSRMKGGQCPDAASVILLSKWSNLPLTNYLVTDELLRDSDT